MCAMQVDVKVERAAEALDQGDGTSLGRLTSEPRLLDQVRSDAAVDDAEHPAHDLGATGEQEAQRIREAQHPLAHRLLGKHLVDQQRGALGHAPRAAARTEAAPLAAERDQVLGMTRAAANSKTNTSGTHLNSRRLAPKGWRAGGPESNHA